MEKETINVALSTDDNYACHTAATMASVLDNANKEDNLHFYIMGNISNKTKEKLRKLKKIKPFKLTFFRVDETKLKFLQKVKINVHVSMATYYKLFMPEFFPHINKMIWLDSDLIVLKSLKEFWDIDIEDYYFGAVPDLRFVRLGKELQIPEKYTYINTGTFLMNLKKMREENALLHMEKYVFYNYKIITIADQGVTNGAFYDKIKLIDHKWNAYHEFIKESCDKHYKYLKTQEYIDAFNSPAIVHFVGPQKPWLAGIKHPYKNAYWQYLRKTEWSNNYYKHIFSEINLALSNKFSIKIIDSENYATYKFINIPIWKRKKRETEKIYNLMKKLDLQINKQNEKIEFINQHINRKISNLNCLIQAQTLHKETFYGYKNIYAGKEIVLLATGPSAKDYTPIKGAIHVGVNGAVNFENCKLDYLFVQDNAIAQEQNKEMNAKADAYIGNNCKKFYGIIPDERLKQLGASSIKRISQTSVNNTGAAQYILEDIPYNKIAYDITREPLGDLEGVVFSAIQFILYTNPKRIYLVGCDCSYGYFYQKKSEVNMDAQKRGWNMIADFARDIYPDVEIVSINPVGLKGLFKDLYTNIYSNVKGN